MPETVIDHVTPDDHSTESVGKVVGIIQVILLFMFIPHSQTAQDHYLQVTIILYPLYNLIVIIVARFSPIAKVSADLLTYIITGGSLILHISNVATSFLHINHLPLADLLSSALLLVTVLKEFTCNLHVMVEIR